ncbi:uncharacterized protein LOC120348838 isoform X2 [Nilaparvata lugens]|uniref:uncharacterized protein LOC120348838 isoform X2 n=1 Tax=Nilaparvata lugens TaxID=108931 RepID=UPI00193DC7FC|nr:uncharacterized protein LOC120348838 isoform X2 [Nilaparvata lugens]
MYSALSSAVCNALSSCSSERNDVTRLGRLLAEMSKKLDDMLKASNPISFDVGRPSTATSENQDAHSHSDTTEFESAAFQSTQIDFNLDESKRRFGCEPSSSRPTTSNQSMFKEILHSKMQNKDRVSGQSSSAQSSDIAQGRRARSESESDSDAEVKDSSHREDAVAERTPITDWRIKTHKKNGKVELLGCYLYWMGVIGVESLSTFQAPRRTNNHLESFHARMLAAFGVNLDVWSFIRKLREVERSSFDDLQRIDRDDPQRVRRARSDNNANSDAIRMALRRLTRQEITLINFLTTVSHCADNLIERGFVQQHNGLQEAVVVDEEIIEWMLPVAGEEVVVAAENVRPPARRRRRRQQGVLQRPIEAQQQPHAAPRLSNCVICLNNECTHIALPCGHICMCEECAEQNLLHMNGQPRCPLCNIHCTHYQRVYLNFQ